MAPRTRRLYAPRPARVEVGTGLAPVAVDGVAVEAVREEWVVRDRGWTGRRLARHYYELALADGGATVVFRSAPSRRWGRQRA